MASRCRGGYIATSSVVFERGFELFLAALEAELIYRLDHWLGVSLSELGVDGLEEVLGGVERVLLEEGLSLDEDARVGLKISSEGELEKELRVMFKHPPSWLKAACWSILA